MGEETITVGEVSRSDAAGASVELPIVDLLTGRGFITGKSGSGKSNSASVVAEKLLDRGYSLLAVDIDGEYYGLKEDYEILHVGADEECDLRVNVEHAEKIAELALEQNVPIILDVSSFLEESEARDLLTEVTKHLFAKEKKRKQPFLLLVEEIHEYIPEGGGVDECGKMLIKVSKRGRKHGLGIVGISQRPADVKKDFITQCDWLVWHRLTWNNDTKVVGRILGSEYADYVEEMDDGECFLVTDWLDDVRVVQWERKRTFDAGATPGLEDFERPELKSVSGDLVSELEAISEEQRHRQDRIQELERELARKDERIADLEGQLSEARDLERMADRFSRAMMEQATGRVPDTGEAWQGDADGAAAARDEDSDDATSGEAGDDDTLDVIEAMGGPPEKTDPVEPTGEPPDAPETAAGSIGRSAAPDQDADATADTDEGTTTGIDVAGDDGSGFETETSLTAAATGGSTPDSLVTRLRDEIHSLEALAVEMLRFYRSSGPTTPLEAHAAAGGSGERTAAYATNRALRQRGLVEHVGRGQHDYALPSLVVEESRNPFAPEATLPDGERDRLVDAVESAFVESVDAPGGDDGAGILGTGVDDTGVDDTGVDDDSGAHADGPVVPWPDH